MARPPLPRVAGVVGWPIGHSLSPLIHQTWARREGVDAAYLPIAVETGYDAFARALDALREIGFKGVNITLPHKENALKYASSASKAARRAGAANMLTFGNEGPYADNSDITGFSAALRETMEKDAKISRAVVLGAGGAARGVVIALKSLGVGEILIVNRTAGKALRLAKDFSVSAVAWADRAEALEGADLLVNTTSLGMSGAPPLDISLRRLPETAVVADIVYRPLETALLAAARERGHRTADGLSMLMHQAVPGYKAWLGTKAAVDADLRRRLEAALSKTEPL